MRIGIDVRTLETSHRFRGIGIYARNLIRNLSQLDHQNHYIFYSQKINSEAEKEVQNQDFHFNNYQVRKTADSSKYNWLLDQLYLPQAIKKSQVDLVHFLDQLSCPIFKKAKTIVTVNDIIQVANFFSSPGVKNKIKFSPVVKADKIITISQAGKNDLKNFFSIPDHKIKVIYDGYDKNIFQPVKERKKIAAFRQRVFRDRKTLYLLYVGSFQEFEPRKNIDFLINIFAKVSASIKNLHLVMIGKKGLESQRIEAIFRKKNLHQKVIFTDFISDQDLVLYFNAASIFLFPSLYEGFGLPPLEAMACGCPVISSNKSSLPEVVGEGGILLSPVSVIDWVKSIKQLIADQKLRHNYIKRGRQQAQKFSWEKCARETLETYEEIYQSKN